MNAIILDNPLHGDPGLIVVTKATVKYLEEASFVYPYKNGGEAPVQDIIAPATADVSPAKR